MTSWKMVRFHLADAYDLLVDEDNLLLVDVAVTNGRRQEVYVTYHEGTLGPGWVRLDGGFAEVPPLRPPQE
jgi:hypothetical protein